VLIAVADSRVELSVNHSAKKLLTSFARNAKILAIAGVTARISFTTLFSIRIEISQQYCFYIFY